MTKTSAEKQPPLQYSAASHSNYFCDLHTHTCTQQITSVLVCGLEGTERVVCYCCYCFVGFIIAVVVTDVLVAVKVVVVVVATVVVVVFVVFVVLVVITAVIKNQSV